MLQSAGGGDGMIAPPTHYEEYLAEKQLHDQQQAHNYLKQQLRQTVLTRVGSQANQLEEASESEEPDVIDLTGKKELKEESEMSKQQKDREQFLQQQRDLIMRHTLHNEATAYPGGRSAQARPLSRALSSPLVHLGQCCIIMYLSSISQSVLDKYYWKKLPYCTTNSMWSTNMQIFINIFNDCISSLNLHKLSFINSRES